MVLSIVSDVHIVADGQFSGCAGLLFEQHPGQGGFACAVFPDERHLFLTRHDEVQTFKDGQVIEALLEGLGFENDFARAWCGREAEPNLHVFRSIHFHAFELVEFLDQALGEGGLVLLGPELVDEHFRLLDVLLLVLGCLLLT